MEIMEKFYLIYQLKNYLIKVKNKLEDNYVDLVSSLPEKEYYDKNSNTFDGIYKKKETDEIDDNEDLYDEYRYKLDGKYKKVLLDKPTKPVYGMMNNRLLDCLKSTLENALKGDETNYVIDLQSEEYRLINDLAKDKDNCPKIADELMSNLI